MNRYYGFWLLFGDEDRRTLNFIIKDLNDQYGDGNVFEPHVSLLYAEEGLMRTSEKQSLVENVKTPSKLKVVKAGIVDPGVDGEMWKDFGRWRVVFEYEFG